MKVELTDQERKFLLQLLDQVTVRGVQSKALVIQLMLKLEEEDDPRNRLQQVPGDD